MFTSHLKSTLNLYLQILRLYFVADRAKIVVVAGRVIDDENTKNEEKKESAPLKSGKKKKNKKLTKVYLFDIFPDFSEFDANLFTFEVFQTFTSGQHDDESVGTNHQMKYDGVKSVKFEVAMTIAKKWIAGALDLATSWNLDSNKLKRCIVVELCNNFKDEVALQLMRDDIQYSNVNDSYDTHNKQLLAKSLLHIVKKRTCHYINQLLHSPQHQHVLAGIPADSFQDLLHYNDHYGKDKEGGLSSRDRKEIKNKPNKVLAMNLKLTLSINHLMEQDDLYEKSAKQEINVIVQILHLLMQSK